MGDFFLRLRFAARRTLLLVSRSFRSRFEKGVRTNLGEDAARTSMAFLLGAAEIERVLLVFWLKD